MMAAATTATMTTTKPPTLRHEIKHQIRPTEDRVLSQRLARLFARDPHAGPDGTYLVTSLYFDTPYDTALRQKLDGVNRREKFRLRYYGEDLTFLRLEKKFKVNGLCGKRSVRLTLEQVQSLLAGEYGFLLQSGHPLLVEFYSKLQGQLLRPKTVVRYQREAFRYGPGNVRLTLDRDIRSGLGQVNFLDPNLLCLPVMEGCTLLEVKYDAFLPEIVRMAIQIPDRRGASCSKYALCRRMD